MECMAFESCLIWMLVGLIAGISPYVAGLFRDVPWLYAARRCLLNGQRPGEKRFWTRLSLFPAFVIQTAREDGRVGTVTVVAPHFRKSDLAALAASDDRKEAWQMVGDGYVVNLTPYLKRLPALARARVTVEYDPRFGACFRAERSDASVS
jgi:hypothetical protein